MAGNEGSLVHWARACRPIVERPASLGATHALCVVHRGQVVHEWYGPGLGPESTLISWSVAKSITHALVGIAVGEGLLDPSMSGLFPGWAGDERSTIRLDDLLTMRSGLSWVEDYVDDEVSDVIEMLFGRSSHAGDHAGFAADKPLVHRPGTHWLYSSGTTNLITAVLARALGEPRGESGRIEAFVRDRLFAPLSMTSATIKCDATGNFVGSSYVYATARDFARFGALYRADGMVDGVRILPEGWVDGARQQVAFDPDMQMGYGRQWWTWPTDDDSLIAHGYRGQLVWVSPHRDLVVVHLGHTEAEHVPHLRSLVADLVAGCPRTSGPIGNDGGDG